MRRPNTGWRRALGHAALVGGTASACGDCLAPPAARSWPIAVAGRVAVLQHRCALTALVLTNTAPTTDETRKSSPLATDRYQPHPRNGSADRCGKPFHNGFVVQREWLDRIRLVTPQQR